MPLPSRFARFDELLDMLVEELLREDNSSHECGKPAVPGRAKPRAGDQFVENSSDQVDNAT